MTPPDTPANRTESRHPRLRRGAYMLPSLFTIGNIFFGFFAVVSGLNGQFQRASVLLFCAGLLDALDGRIARLTGTESQFGRQFDSLADVLTFGMAPALLVYSGLSQDFGRPAWLVPLFYLVCAASRLARFNVQAHARTSRYFVGLPVPAAACSIGAIILFAHNRAIDALLGAPLLIAVIFLGILMVSTFRYSSFKSVDLRRRWSYRMALPVAASLLVIGYDPPIFFLAVGIIYTSWPPVAWLLERTGLRRRSDSQHPTEEATG